MIELINKIHNANDMKEQLGVIAKKWLLEYILQEDMKIEAWKKILYFYCLTNNKRR